MRGGTGGCQSSANTIGKLRWKRPGPFKLRDLRTFRFDRSCGMRMTGEGEGDQILRNDHWKSGNKKEGGMPW